MKSRVETIREGDLDNCRKQQKVEEELSLRLGIPSIRAGKVIIRDEREWRVNERQIEYCWLINVSRSFVGWCWLFSIKFNENKFREIRNPEELIQGIFTINEGGSIDSYYCEVRDNDFEDRVREFANYDLFDVNGGITLDGIGYEYLVFAPNATIKMSLNNPNSENWKKWEEKIRDIGECLSRKSGIEELERIFK